jgi:asparagine synthase (glutamine-hydrolysing)
MCNTIVHRGPNDQGLHIEGPVGIGMRRLSVIDLNTGHQPISNETKDVWVVFNGEIYNYKEIARGLNTRGHRLTTTSDTEVIVHLYEELAEECVQKMRGMFAFALWDRTRSRLLLARDRLGVKPLYYYYDGQRLVFGSELKAILVHPAVQREIDPQAVLYYLRYSYIPDPLSIFRKIRKLPPAHVLTISGRTLTVRPYWDGVMPPQHGSPVTEADAASELLPLLQEAVRLRLVSDVPLGAFLSGGIDSSLVVALMAQEMTRPVKTFSIGFKEESYNELPYAREVAKHLGTDHHELVVGPRGCDLIERIVSHFDEPFGDASAIPTYHLSKLAADHVTVALSGDGGDELFAGYDRYRVDLDRSRFEALPSVARQFLASTSAILPEGFYGKRFLRNISLSSRARFLENISYISPNHLEGLLSSYFYEQLAEIHYAEPIMEDYFDDVKGQPWLSQLQYLEAKTYLPADVLTKVDRMSMAHSLEVRSPFLDHILIEEVRRLPVDLKLRNGVAKYLLKRIAERFLPEHIVHRKKQGFGVPLEYWFKDELKSYVHDTLLDGRCRARGIFRPAALERLVQRYERGENSLSAVIWMLIILETWSRLYIDGSGWREFAMAGTENTAVR